MRLSAFLVLALVLDPVNAAASAKKEPECEKNEEGVCVSDIEDDATVNSLLQIDTNMKETGATLATEKSGSSSPRRRRCPSRRRRAPYTRRRLPVFDKKSVEQGDKCDNTCDKANDGECKDGGVNTNGYAACVYGTDCEDCGARPLCWAVRLEYYVVEGHTLTTECYEDLEEAKRVCIQAGDCGAIASQLNVCDGKYRVSHGGPTVIKISDDLADDYAPFELKVYQRATCDENGDPIDPCEGSDPAVRWDSGEGCFEKKLDVYTAEIPSWEANPVCYDLETAKEKCKEKSDCQAITHNRLVCEGYRLSTGDKATWIDYANADLVGYERKADSCDE